MTGLAELAPSFSIGKPRAGHAQDDQPVLFFGIKNWMKNVLHTFTCAASSAYNDPIEAVRRA